MKRTLGIGLLFTATAVCSLAQGTILFGNIFAGPTSRTFLAPIYASDPSNPLLEMHGNTPTGVPTGIQEYPGGLLNTPGFLLGLFIGESQIGNTQPIRTSATGDLPAGLIFADILVVPNVAPGNTAQLEIRAWDGGNGADTWAKALASDAPRGRSGLFTTDRLGGVDDLGNIHFAPNTVGWQSFNVVGFVQVPEPSTIASVVLGLGSLLLFRRRK